MSVEKHLLKKSSLKITRKLIYVSLQTNLYIWKKSLMSWILADDDPRKKKVECGVCGKLLTDEARLAYHMQLHILG